MQQQREINFMRAAIELSRKSLDHTVEGGPFGCVIVRHDEIIGKGWNRVIATNDPTAHAEVVAIRDACAHLGTHQLDDCEIYASCEPCPMCLGAIYWARPRAVYFANTRADAAAIGFDDHLIYEELKAPVDQRIIPMTMLGRDEAIRVFEEWKKREDRTAY